MSEETVFPPFRVSPAAVSQIETVGGSVRIDISAGGCCGRRYVFTACSRSFGAEWPGPGQPDCQSYVPMPWD